MGRTWNIQDAIELYGIDRWSLGFFTVDSTGHVAVRQRVDSTTSVSLWEIVRGLNQRGISSPVTIGFPNILRSRMLEMTSAFATAIRENNYRGHYSGVYPIKVNQQRFLVETVEADGRELGFGLEVGSKPELLAVLALTAGNPDCLIICNGFKERHYLNHILLATKLGRTIVAVIENIHELETLIDVCRESGVRPRIGIRLKLESHGSGRWSTSTGDKAKFGLTMPGVYKVVSRLREVEMLDCLQLVHCHMGSQLSDIQVVNSGLTELTRVYVELCRLGAGMRFIDVGGGLGVDYDGSKTNSDFSINYTLREYADTVVYRIMIGCDNAGVDHPTIVTEAGRALVTHYCVLVSDVLDVNRIDFWVISADEARSVFERFPEAPGVVEEIIEAFESVAEDRLLQAFHDAEQAHEEALTLFRVGLLDLELRAFVDRVFWSACLEVSRLAKDLEPAPEELQDLELRISDTYFLNLSIFQSLPDAWAIGQIFPIMPIHRLDEAPTRRATLVDITCDSDGKIDRFIDLEDPAPTLALHPLNTNEKYYLGIFLTGAYQETLGDLHNLFGDANLVHITLDEAGDWSIEEIVEGDSVSTVLKYLQYEPRSLIRAVRRDCEAAIRNKALTVAEGRLLLEAFETGLNGSTYLE